MNDTRGDFGTTLNGRFSCGAEFAGLPFSSLLL